MDDSRGGREKFDTWSEHDGDVLDFDVFGSFILRIIVVEWGVMDLEKDTNHKVRSGLVGRLVIVGDIHVREKNCSLHRKKAIRTTKASASLPDKVSLLFS